MFAGLKRRKDGVSVNLILLLKNAEQITVANRDKITRKEKKKEKGRMACL